MTREEAIDEILGLDFETDPDDYNRHLVDVREVCEIVERIFDDFENERGDYHEGIEEGYKICVKERVCKNCKWFNEKRYECKNTENYQEVGNYDNVNFFLMQVDENFGCNRFERITK